MVLLRDQVQWTYRIAVYTIYIFNWQTDVNFEEDERRGKVVEERREEDKRTRVHIVVCILNCINYGLLLW